MDVHDVSRLTMAERELLEDEAAAYVLDSLEDAEQLVYAAHLDRCPTCRRFVATYAEVVNWLDAALAGRATPSDRRADAPSWFPAREGYCGT